MGDSDGRLRSNRINDLMMESFKKANGSYICNDLLGYDISTPEGIQSAREVVQPHILKNMVITGGSMRTAADTGDWAVVVRNCMFIPGMIWLLCCRLRIHRDRNSILRLLQM